MNFSALRKKLVGNIINIPGWRTNRKIVVIESDDWGSIRMPSREVLEKLVKQGIGVDKLSYNRYDSLASEEDLSALFEVLHSVKDYNGNPAVITANTVVANPDFEKIRKSEFQSYFYEPFTETLKRYPKHQRSFSIWREGISEKVFQPQFHGREHLNVTRWLKALQNNTGKVRLAFDLQMFDLSESLKISENSFMQALNFESVEELEFQKKWIAEGTAMFEKIFGFRSKTFIAPCHKWSNALNADFFNNGIKGFQGTWLQFEPKEGKEHTFKKIFHYTGQKNHLGQIYLVRNAAFEPSQYPGFDYLSDALNRIRTAFLWRKPAIISTHRLNFIGFIEPENRDKNLKLLSILLKEMKKRWPEVEFMSSDELARLIFNQ